MGVQEVELFIVNEIIMSMNVNMASVFLKNHVVFSGLNEQQINDLCAVARQHILKKGNRLVINARQANRIYFLISGKMKIVGAIKENNQSVKDILYVGEMFGNVSLSDHAGEEYAEALVHSTIVYCFGVNEFKQLLKIHHRLALNYSDNISQKLSQLKERYTVWTKHDTKTRFVYLLQKWAVAEGKEKGDKIILHNYLSLTDIADILSVSRQFMYVLLKEMSESGQLRYGRGEIELSKSLIEEFNLN